MPLGYVIFEGFLKKPVFSLLYLFSLSPFFPFGEPGRLVRNEGHLRADELDVREGGGFRFGFALGLLFLLADVFSFKG